MLPNPITDDINGRSKFSVILFGKNILLRTNLIRSLHRWKQYNSVDDTKVDSCFIGVMANCLWLLKETDATVLFKVLGELPYPKDNKFSIVRMKVPEPKATTANSKRKNGLLYPDEYYKALLNSYFRLDVDLDKHYEQWSAAHRHFREEATRFFAIRMLDQEPVENLFSFICSQNNHISRISSLVEKLCSSYGPKICDFEGVEYYAFPDAEKLSGAEVGNDSHIVCNLPGFHSPFTN